VQGLVQEMKADFMSALEQLSTMQDGGDQTDSVQHLTATCRQQGQQLTDVAETLKALKVSTKASNSPMSQRH
jgi:hypothetical protein